MDQIIASIKTLVATQNKTALSLDRIEKRVNARRYAEDYEEEENIEEIRQAQRVWREQASRGKKETYMSEKRRHARRYGENDHPWSERNIQ
jgi:hypothetical protein